MHEIVTGYENLSGPRHRGRTQPAPAPRPARGPRAAVAAFALLLGGCPRLGEGRAPDDPLPPSVPDLFVEDLLIPQTGDQAGALMTARLYAPMDVSPGARLPAISIVPGAGAPRNPPAAVRLYDWAGTALARAGYVVLFTVPAENAPKDADPTGYARAQASGIDCLLSSACNPRHAQVDPAAIGVAGHSQGARASIVVQEQDQRVKALVAWDNLSSGTLGDAGTGARCDAVPGRLVIPRVPAMGQSSETCDKDANAKKTGFAHWQKAGVPSMQVALAGFQHSSWARDYTDAQGALIVHYTVAWFDRYLKNDKAAETRLLSRTPAGTKIEDALSARYRSAYFDGTGTCDDLRDRCP